MKKGFSLIEAMIAIGITSIISMAIMSLISNLQKDQTSLTEKLQNSETKNLLLVAMNNGATCNLQIVTGTPSPIDLSAATTTVPSPNSINYNELRAGPTPTSPIIAKVGQSLNGIAGRMIVQTITLSNILSTGNLNEFVGDWTITLRPTTTMQVLKPITLAQIFNVAPPLNAAVVMGCGATGTNPTFYAEQLVSPAGPGGTIVPGTPRFPLNAPISPMTWISTQDLQPGNYTVVLGITVRPNRCNSCWSPATFTVSVNGVAAPYAPTANDDDESEHSSLRGDTIIIRNVNIPYVGPTPLRIHVTVGKLPTGGGSGLEALTIQAIKQ